MSIDEIIRNKRARYAKPGEDELRSLPFKTAFIYGRVSSPEQVRDSKESIGQIADLVDLAKDDGYRTEITAADVENRLIAIQKGEAQADTWSDGEVVVDVRVLGISGTISGEQRTGMQHLLSRLKSGEVGAVYVTEGMSRISRDKDKVEPYQILQLMKAQDCRVRTPEEVRNPNIDRDWHSLETEIVQAVGESAVHNRRLLQRKRRKAARGDFIGEPIPAGLMVPKVDTAPNGRYIYGRLEPYEPHANVTEKVLKEFRRQQGSTTKTILELKGLCYPLFPPELAYMERLSSLRTALKTEHGYRITRAMIRGLAMNEKLIGYWTWGDTGPSGRNHESIISDELFYEVYALATQGSKPRGRAIKFEPQEWAGLLYCCDHDIPRRMSSHTSKKSYRCEHDDEHGILKTCFDIKARYLDEPLSTVVLKQLDLTPFAEELFLEMESNSIAVSTEAAEIKREIRKKEQRIKNLEGYLGSADKEREETYWQLIAETKRELVFLQIRHATANQSRARVDYKGLRDVLAALPEKWQTYSSSRRNDLLKSLIERVEIRREGQTVTAHIIWRTGFTQEVSIRRSRVKGIREGFWTDQEMETLRTMFPEASWEDMLNALPGRTVKSISHKADKMELKRVKGARQRAKGRRWTPGDEAETRKLYEGGWPVSYIAEQTSRSEQAIRQHAANRGWRRNGHVGTKGQVPYWREVVNPKVCNGESWGRG